MTREEAVRYFKQHIDLYCVEGICREAEEIAIEALERELEALPPVTPQQKIGHWIKNEWGNIFCSSCGCAALYDKVYPGESVFGKAIRVKSTFCPTCGAKMQEVQK